MPKLFSHTERAAYHRAADLAKSHAEHWERAARANPDDPESLFSAGMKAGHWRIIDPTFKTRHWWQRRCLSPACRRTPVARLPP
jgi:hypothetical protein